MKKLKYIIVASILLLAYGCQEDYLETQYRNGLDEETISELLETSPETTVNGYVTAIYTNMVKPYSGKEGDIHDQFGYAAILHVADMTAQDMVQKSAHWFTFDYQFKNRIKNYRRPKISWQILYSMIADANVIINLYKEEPKDVVAKGGLGQAYATRALAYYYLIQLFQKSNTADVSIADLPGVPLRFADSEGIDEATRKQLTSRNTIKIVREQIEKDITKAVALLDGYKRPYKYFIDQDVANGIAARYYLLIGDWAKAEAHAKAAHTAYNIMPPAKLHDGFMDIKNTEWMWGFDHTTETQTTYASFFAHISSIAPGYSGLGYAPRLIDAELYSKIPATDERKSLFVDEDGKPNKNNGYDNVVDMPFANLKFGDKGDWTMDYVYMRAAEMVLIEAEALARQGKETEAATALKKLMSKRDSQWNKSTVSIEDVILQRRIELWGEGFNYFDLKRTNTGVVRSYAESNHREKIDVPANDKRWVYQIPLAEIDENPMMDPDKDQNP